jgi:hypothetical protein
MQVLFRPLPRRNAKRAANDALVKSLWFSDRAGPGQSIKMVELFDVLDDFIVDFDIGPAEESWCGVG